MRKSALLLLVALLPAPDVFGQQMELTIREGFSPDPQRIAVQAGGNRELTECGYGFSEEFIMLSYIGAGNSDLYIYVEGDTDTMLGVMDPGSEIICDDDSHEGLNPLVHLPRARGGIYGVVVGSYTSGSVSDVTLFISGTDPRSSSGGESSGMPDLSLEPTSGRVSLSAPFSPDPHTVSISAGGSVDVDVTGCGYGYVARAPDYNLTYSGSGSALYFFVRSDEDTTLLINRPDASWICDDDSLGDSNPVVTIPNAGAGLYNIWVGTYSDGDLSSATLYISTTGTAPGGSSSGSESGMPDLSLEPTYGRVSLSAPFSPDPHTVSISAGGSVDVDVGGCGYGYVARAPDYNLTYSGSGSALYFFARSDEDTTLLINKPDASWICDDDSLGDSNPVVTIPNAGAGLYNIWVGTYSSEALTPATLYISTRGAK